MTDTPQWGTDPSTLGSSDQSPGDQAKIQLEATDSYGSMRRREQLSTFSPRGGAPVAAVVAQHVQRRRQPARAAVRRHRGANEPDGRPCRLRHPWTDASVSFESHAVGTGATRRAS